MNYKAQAQNSISTLFLWRDLTMKSAICAWVVLALTSFLCIGIVCVGGFADESSEISVLTCNVHCPDQDSKCAGCCQGLGYKQKYSSCRGGRCLCRNVNPFEPEDSFAGAGGEDLSLTHEDKPQIIKAKNTYTNYQPPQTNYSPPKNPFGYRPSFAPRQPSPLTPPKLTSPQTYYTAPKPQTPAQTLPKLTASPQTYFPARRQQQTPTQAPVQESGSPISGCDGLCPRQEYKCSLCCRDGGFKVQLSNCKGKTCVCR